MPQREAPPTARATKHEELTAELRSLARSLAPGERFPSQNELMRRYAVSDRTVLRSLDDLRREGMIVRRVGSGTFIAERGDVSSASSAPTLAVLALADNPFFRHCVDELNRQATTRGLGVVCQYAVPQRLESTDALMLEALRPAGFLVFSHRLADMAATVRGRGHRTVVVGMPPLGAVPADLHCVTGDHEHGGALAVGRLLGAGHRRVGFLSLDLDPARLSDTPRWKGYTRALREAGIDPEASPVFGRAAVDGWARDPEACRRALTGRGAPTALAAWTDAEAVVALQALRAAHLRVPDDLSLIAYDNVPVGALAEPPLDTIDPHIDVQIRRALDLLTSEDASGGGALVSVTPTLLVRRSCAAPSIKE